jgi:hypothetical protein
VFFCISSHQRANFSLHWTIGNIHVDTDTGWQSQKHKSTLFIYKGYTDQGKLDQQLLTIDNSALGNFCIIAIDQEHKTIKLTADRYRSFPIYFENQQAITNLMPLINTAWTDSIVESDFDLNVTEHKVDVIGSVNLSELSYKSALDQVDNILFEKTKQFVANNDQPLKVFLSGGVDTLLVYSYLVRTGATFELIECNHLDHDYFWRENSHLIKQFWAYSQIHHWKQPCVLASGAPGDEFMLRSPTTANLFLTRHGTSIPQLLEQYPDCLHHPYFSQKKHTELFKAQQSTPQNQSDWMLCNIVANDWQHWHLGNTLTWTPLRDLEIFKVLLRLPLPHAINQIMNSEFSRCLIENNAPGATRFLSDQKNTGASLKNLNRLFHSI